MKHTKKVEVPAAVKEVVDRVTCDFCGENLPKRDYRFSEVTLQIDVGSSYPEAGGGEKTIFDCCAACWEDKVTPALLALGAKPRVEEWDF